MGNDVVKPDPERMHALNEFPTPNGDKSLRRVLGMFAYYAKWIDHFADKGRPLAVAKNFPLSGDALNSFKLLKSELVNVALHSIDEQAPFVAECDASDVAVFATLNQRGHPVAFTSRTGQGREIHYPTHEKEATAIIEAIRKWSHLLSRQTFMLVTDQRSVAFMFDSRRCSMIKTDKIQQWRVELASLSYITKYRPGQQNVGPDSFSRAFCSSTHPECALNKLHTSLCHLGVTRMLHFVRSKNLPYCTTDVRRIMSNCEICAEVKPRFYRPEEGSLIKAVQPMARLKLDFKGPLQSNRKS